MTNPTDKNHLEKVPIRDAFWNVSHLSTGTAPDGGDDWLITKKDFNAYADAIEQHYTKKLELEKLRARRDEQCRTNYFRYDNGDVEVIFDGSDIDSKRQDDRLGEIDAQIAELERSNGSPN